MVPHNPAHSCNPGHTMITYNRSTLWKRGWFWVPVVGVLIGAAIWWWQMRVLPTRPAAAASDVAAADGIIRPMAAGSGLTPLPAPTLDGAPPSDFTRSEWAALKEAMARTENPEQELARVVAYLRFQRGFERWQGLQGGPDAASRRTLAQQLLDGVPERVRQGEISAGEAMLLQTALLVDIEPDDQARQQRLAQLQAELAAVAPKPDAEQQAREAALLAEYKRREAAIVADYQARPENMRNHAQLEEALESARRAVYGGRP